MEELICDNCKCAVDFDEKVKILTEIFKELQNKDLIDLQTVKEIIKNTELKIKF